MGLGLTHVLSSDCKNKLFASVNKGFVGKIAREEGDRYTWVIVSLPGLLKDDCFISHVRSN